MKNVLFIDHVNRILGGAEINLIELCDWAGKASIWRITCAVAPKSPVADELTDLSPKPPAIIDYQLGAGLNEMRIVGKHPLAPLKKAVAGLVAMRDAGKRLESILRDLRPDVVVSIPNKDHLVASTTCRRLGIPHVWWVNDILSADFFPWLARTTFFRAAKAGDGHFAAVSRYAAQSLIDGGLPADRVHTIHNGIPIDKYSRTESAFRSSFNIPESSFTFGIVGRWCHWKGQDHFLDLAEAWVQRYPDSKVHFLVIGRAFNEDQDFEEMIRGKANALNTRIGHEVVRMIPFQSDLKSVLSSLDCMVHASIHPEPFGRVIIEAMACKTPVIGAEAGAVPEIISHQKDGLLARAGNLTSYLTQMEFIYQNPDQAQKMGNNAFDKVNQHFSVARVAHDFNQVFEKAGAR